MDLAAQLFDRIADPALSHGERARLRCRLAKVLEDAGDYEEARAALGELWRRVGERPALKGLDDVTAAEVLLRAGVLTGWIGSVGQIEGAQETAKNLISESIRMFETLHETEKVAEAQSDLAVCYWREGAFDEARVMLQDALAQLSADNSEQKAVVLLRSALVERSARRYEDALRIHTEAAPLFEASQNYMIAGRFHAELALVLRNLSTAEHNEDYIDRALIEYAAASFHFEQAGHTRYQGCVENNLGFLFYTVGKFAEAHEHLDHARRLFVGLKDSVHTAQVDETRARVLLAEGREVEAEQVACAAVRTLEKGDEQSLLAEALTTHGKALARTGRHERARLTLQHAVLVAEQAGDLERAGEAALTIIEELCEHSAPAEMCRVYERAAGLLAGSQHPDVRERLVACARRVMRMFIEQISPGEDVAGALAAAPSNWEGFSFKVEIRRHERLWIRRALKDAGGVVTRAAQLLGFKHHYSLIALMNQRHRDLLPARSPIVPRRRSIFRGAGDHPQKTPDQSAPPVTILYAEADRMIAGAVKGALEPEGWRVESCADGPAALTKILGDARYDLLLLDNDLPGVKGLEILRLTRKLSHRRRTPVFILSASDCETEAWRAGADAFLRKPKDVTAITEIIARLLRS